MARPKSDEKRNAIMTAATRIVAAEGLGAPTAAIAKAAGVSNGALFTYFETKAALLNQLYIELKTEMAAAAVAGLPPESDNHTQMRYMWAHWVRWATSFPDKRRTLALLNSADEVTPLSHQAGHRTMAGIALLLEQCRDNGPMRDAPLGLVVALMTALAEATIDYIIYDPASAEQHSTAGFDALWRLLA